MSQFLTPDMRNVAKLFVQKKLRASGRKPNDACSFPELMEASREAAACLSISDTETVSRFLMTQFTVIEPLPIPEAAGDGSWITSEAKSSWRRWNRYRSFLVDRIDARAVDEVDASTDSILNIIGNLALPGELDKRGVVYGDVQSGKTNHFMALANKALDAGANLVIVLAGIDNDLRTQSQLRIDEAVLGAPSVPDAKASASRIGVGLIDPGIQTMSLTNRDDDFSKNTQFVSPSALRKVPAVLVIKKLPAIMKHLGHWIDRNLKLDGHAKIDLSAVVIDDECDHASIDTRTNTDDSPEHSPTPTNSEIRRLLCRFARCAYIGYSGTPFANALLAADRSTRQDGDDIHPRDFFAPIIASPSYIGAEKIFGLPSLASDDDDGTQVSSLSVMVRPYDDMDGWNPWIPLKHRSSFRPQGRIPASLRSAILHFIFNCGIRHGRNNSMLVNVTTFTAVQKIVCEAVRTETETLVNQIIHGDRETLEELRSLWEKTILPKARSISSLLDGETETLALASKWDAAIASVIANLGTIDVVTINSDSEDVLRYHQPKPINVIAIGGRKLGRGVTLDGLSVSYYHGSTNLQDNLLQRGRWFGYRPGYASLCAIYMTEDNIDNFREATLVSRNLRTERILAGYEGSEEHPLRVTYSKGHKATAANKMRGVRIVDASPAGTLSETKIFHSLEEIRSHNLATVSSMVAALGAHDHGGDRPHMPESHDASHGAWSTTYLWQDVPVELLLEHLTSYQTHPNAIKASTREMLHRMGALRSAAPRYNVLIRGSKETDRESIQIGTISVKPRLRSTDKDLALVDRHGKSGKYTIKRLLTETDELLDLTRRQLDQAHEISAANGTSLYESSRVVRTNGLVLIYPVIPAVGKLEDWSPTCTPYIGIGVTFPGIRSKESYLMNGSEGARKTP